MAKAAKSRPSVKATTAAAKRTGRTDRARASFLETLRETCNVSHSARQAGIARRTVYEWRDADEQFAADWDDAVEEAIDKLEMVARERAVDNSDKMLEILLKAHRPDKFVERRQIEHGATPAMAAAITAGMTAKQAAEEFRKELD